MELDAHIEALLFWKGEAVSIRELAKVLGVKEQEVVAALPALRQKLAGRGMRLMQKDTEVELRTAPEASERIEAMRKEELSKDLGKAGLETLSIVLYKGPLSRSDIDYIRGVNSTFILRNLLIRGLVERVVNKKDQRSFLYKPTLELLAFLGITKVEDLPDYAKVREELEHFEDVQAEAGQQEPENTDRLDKATDTE